MVAILDGRVICVICNLPFSIVPKPHQEGADFPVSAPCFANLPNPYFQLSTPDLQISRLCSRLSTINPPPAQTGLGADTAALILHKIKDIPASFRMSIFLAPDLGILTPGGIFDA
jgi:hypothetical protein